MKAINKKSIGGFNGIRREALRYTALAALLLGSVAAQAQTSFSTPQLLIGDYGVATNDNSAVVPDIGAPTIANLAPNAPLWYVWTPTNSGEAVFDTIVDDATGFIPLDTVIGVYTGTNLAKLSLLAANDDAFALPLAPIYSGQQLYTFADTKFTGTTNAPLYPPINFLNIYTLPFSGPSVLRFNAVAFRTYYIAVDSKSVTGQIALNWSLHPSGVFRFATENIDASTSLPLYQCAATESTSPKWAAGVRNFTPNGVLVTVTRMAGSTGRVTVDYETDDLRTTNSILSNLRGTFTVDTNGYLYSTNFIIFPGELAAVPGTDFTPASGTLTFDDFEMSKTILIQVANTTPARPNRLFGIYLSNPQLDPSETEAVSPPRVDNTWNYSLVRILDVNLDPNGPSNFTVTNITPTETNIFLGYSTTATNSVFNFQRANYRVYHAGAGSTFQIYVNRTGTNRAAETILYNVNSTYPYDKNTFAPNLDNNFPLTPGSDYATPQPINSTSIRDRVADFNFPGGYSGSLSWAQNDSQPKGISFNVPQSDLSQFNEDFQIHLYKLDTGGNPYPVGMVADCTVTILPINEIETAATTNNINAPAGAVDEVFNADYGADFFISTTPPNMAHPGTDGEAMGLAVQSDDKCIVVGDFFSYDQTTRNCIARTTASGFLDATFNPGSGANDFISCLALDSSTNIIIGGAFTSYNGTQRNGIARVKPNGTLDTTFNPGAGVNGTVWAVKTLSTGQILIAGDFTTYNGAVRNYVARLNADGSLDTTFNPGAALNAPVYAIGVEADTFLNINRGAAGQAPEDDNAVNVGAPAGILTVNYDFLSVPDDMRIFYGGTNGVLIFDSGLTNGAATVVIPFGPTNGLTTNVLTIVMNQGNGILGTVWFYNATIQAAGANQITLGGAFTSVASIPGQDHIARLLFDGSVDGTFDPGGGVNGNVNAIGIQSDGKVVVGGEFSIVNGTKQTRIARLSNSGVLDTTFYSGTGADDTVYNINCRPDGLIYVGGAFTSYNGTHRLGFTRLNSDGTVDTSFLDTAYNQFAGLTRERYGDPRGTVLASGVQSVGGVLIGGTFSQIGGGEFDSRIRPESNTNALGALISRAAIRNHSNFARLLAGQTPGPGNIGLTYNSYSVNKSSATYFVALTRTNGFLGDGGVNFSVIPGVAESGSDYLYIGDYNGNLAFYQSIWDRARMRSDAIFGANDVPSDIFGTAYSSSSAVVNLALTGNTNNLSDLSAQVQLASPSGMDLFYLGGENIPLGVALGQSSAPLTLIEDRHQSGIFSFAAATYAGSSNAPIAINRAGGSYGVCSVQYVTTTNGSTAVLNSDYRAASGTLGFSAGQTNASFSVQVLQSNYVSTVEKFVNMRLFNAQGPANGLVSLGLTNAVLRIINGNFQGYLNLGATNYSTNLSAGSVTLTVTRTVGNKGLATLQIYSVNGTAVNGTDFVGFTNTLSWNNGDVSPRTFTVPLLNPGILGGSKQFTVKVGSPTLNGSATPALFAANGFTNATVTINNDTSYGTFQFSQPVYQVNENGGTATLSVNRSGSSAGAVTVGYTTFDGGAVSNANYGQTAGTVSFASGQLSAQIIVPITNDLVIDPAPASFYFSVGLTSVSSGGSLGAPVLAQVQISDAESINRPPGEGDSAFNSGSGMNASVLALGLQTDGSIVAGGNFTLVSGAPRNYFARLNADGTLDANGFLYGMAGANNPVYALVSQTDNGVVLGGTFTTINGIIRNRIARVLTDGSLDSSFNPGAGADNTVFALAETFVSGSRKIYVGGAFNNINAVASRGIARLNTSGTVDAGFTVGAGASDVVYAIAVYPTNSVYAGKLLIGGAFTTYNNFNAPFICRLNVDGSLDTNFDLNISTDGGVHAIVIQNDGKVVIGGDFSHVNGTNASRIARFNLDGTIDTAFATNVSGGFNGTVLSLALQADNRIVVGGDFTQANGVTRNRLTRLLPDGKVDPSINFGQGANAAVNAAVIQPNDGQVVIGGAFTQYDGAPHQHIARIYGGSQTGSGNFKFTDSAYQIDENGVFASVTIRRTGGTMGPNPDGSGDVTVQFDTTDATAIAGINYSNVSTLVAFPPAETFKTIFIPVINDHVVTLTLSNIMTLSNPSPPTGISGQDIAPLYIINDDSAVSFSSANYAVAKNTLTGNGTITVTRIGTVFGTCSVDLVNTTNGSAIVGTDYFPTNVTVVFNPGESNKVIQVPVINNNLPEGNTTVVFALSNAVNTLMYSPSNTTLTIIDTVSAPGQLAFAAAAYVVGEGDTNAYLTVLRTNGRAGIVSVNFATVAGSAVSGVNYTAQSGTLTFGDGVTNRIITVPLVENSLVQGPVNFSVTLSGAAGGATLVSPTNTMVTILDDETGIVFASPTNFAAENLSSANVTVLRLYNTNGVVTVNYATTNGTAVAGVNYTASAGTLSFTNGENIKTISVPLINVTNVTGDLQFGVRLSSPGGSAQLIAPSNTVVVVQDADAGLSFTTNNSTVLKNAGVAIITVVCSNPRVEPVVFTTNDVPLSVGYYTKDGSAVAGTDYQSTSGTLVFTNGNTTNTITVPIFNNILVNGNHIFTVVLTNATAPGQIVSPSVQSVVIVDSNSGLRFSQSAYTVFKNGVFANINVFRTGYTDSVVSVNCLVTNGTAINGVNFVATNALLVFSNGVTTRTVSVPIIANSQVQPNLVALLQLLNPTNGYLVPPSAGTLTILENGGSYVIPAGAQIVSESGAGAPNGILDSNETVQVRFAFRDSAGLNVTNLNAILLPTNGVVSPAAVPVSATNYGPLTVYGHSVYRTFGFTVNGTNTQLIAPTFNLYDNTKFIGTAVFGFTVGQWATAFTNTNMIVIRDNTNATPYPSVINVSGIGGTLLKATVTLNRLAHSYPGDVDALVTSPAGTNTLIMANAGGSVGATNLILNFDDAAATYLPQNTKISSGTNKPTSFFPVISFP